MTGKVIYARGKEGGERREGEEGRGGGKGRGKEEEEKGEEERKGKERSVCPLSSHLIFGAETKIKKKKTP